MKKILITIVLIGAVVFLGSMAYRSDSIMPRETGPAPSSDEATSVQGIEGDTLSNATEESSENLQETQVLGEVKEAISYGVCKVNIATDARLIWTRVNREFFNNSPELFDPIRPGKTYMEELEKFILQKFELLGSSGKSKLIK